MSTATPLTFALLVAMMVSWTFMIRYWLRKRQKNQEEFRKLHQEITEADKRIDEAHQRGTSAVEGEEAGGLLEDWKEEYNNDRPHGSLRQMPPARYRAGGISAQDRDELDTRRLAGPEKG